MMKPTPKAAPIMPKFFVRSCGDRDVRDGRLRHRQVAAGDAVERARDEEQRDVADDDARREERVAERRAGERQRQHGLAAVAIRELAEDRRREELHDREHGDQKPEHDVAGSDGGVLAEQVVRRRGVAEQLRENRPEDADAQRVDEDGEDDDPDRMAFHDAASCYRVADLIYNVKPT